MHLFVVFELEFRKEFVEETIQDAGYKIQLNLFTSDSDDCSRSQVLLFVFVFYFPYLHILQFVFGFFQPAPHLFQRHVFPRYLAKLCCKNQQLNSHSHQSTGWFSCYASPGALHENNQFFLWLENLNQLHVIYMLLHPVQLLKHFFHARLIL